MLGKGWRRDLPDVRDYSADHPKVAQAFSEDRQNAGKSAVDLRTTGFFSPIDDQGDLGSCTANAVIGALEFVERKDHGGQYLDHSRRFLYRLTRKLENKVIGNRAIGDVGAEIRNTIKTLGTVGAPPEWAWPYDTKNFDVEPPADVYALAQAYKALVYARLQALADIKATLLAGYPATIGFTCYQSIDNTGVSGDIPVPALDKGEKTDGGHAVVAAGFDDGRPWEGGVKDYGAILIRNSWGTSWGDGGYGWLPYWYWLRSQADDFWVLNRASWVN